jgi:hypothetical protein
MYCELGDIKSELGLTDVESDDMLYAMIDEAKEIIDDYCGRSFNKTASATKYYDGDGAILWIDDLVTLTSIALDEDGDGTYESTLVATDYILYPLNAAQKTSVRISSNSNYGSFAQGVRQGVKIVGVWGYATIPLPIQRMAKKIVIALYNNRTLGGKKSETLGDYSYTLGDLVTLEDQKLLDKYRIIKIG